MHARCGPVWALWLQVVLQVDANDFNTGVCPHSIKKPQNANPFVLARPKTLTPMPPLLLPVGGGLTTVIIIAVAAAALCACLACVVARRRAANHGGALART